MSDTKTRTVLLPTGCHGAPEPHAFYRCPKCDPLERILDNLDVGKRTTRLDSWLMPVNEGHPCQRGCGAEMERI